MFQGWCQSNSGILSRHGKSNNPSGTHCTETLTTNTHKILMAALDGRLDGAEDTLYPRHAATALLYGRLKIRDPRLEPQVESGGPARPLPVKLPSPLLPSPPLAPTGPTLPSPLSAPPRPAPPAAAQQHLG